MQSISMHISSAVPQKLKGQSFFKSGRAKISGFKSDSFQSTVDLSFGIILRLCNFNKMNIALLGTAGS
jgi:hypothetical protein